MAEGRRKISKSVKTASYILGGSVMDYRMQDILSSDEDIKAVRWLMLEMY